MQHANRSGDDLTAGHDVDDPARKRDDCDAIAEISNEGIAERRLAFEPEPRTGADIERWLRSR